MLPSALTDVIEALSRLPGVGSRTAERYAYFLLKADQNVAKNIATSLEHLHDGVKSCPKTFALMSDNDELSPLYDDPRRDKTTVLVVEEALDIYAIENTKSYDGTYHVLGGAISPMDGITADKLHIKELIARVEGIKFRKSLLLPILPSKANLPPFYSRNFCTKNTQNSKSHALLAACHSAFRSNTPTKSH